jgi:hypothetical protein
MQACAEEARGQLPTQMAKGVIVRILSFVAIPHHQASGSMNYGIIHAMYYGLIVSSMIDHICL